jgi:eukaryotic-like serine/threonine-protein kinase
LTRGGGTTATGAGANDAGALWPFKLLTLVLVAASVGGAAWYLYGNQHQGPFVADYKDAPVPHLGVPAAGAIQVEVPLFEREVPPQTRDPAGARRLAQEGDQAKAANQLGVALVRYQEAFQKDPSPEYSLKLGEVNYQREEFKAARGWWQRHLRDAPGSKARTYIEERIRDL